MCQMPLEPARCRQRHRTGSRPWFDRVRRVSREIRRYAQWPSTHTQPFVLDRVHCPGTHVLAPRGTPTYRPFSQVQGLLATPVYFHFPGCQTSETDDDGGGGTSSVCGGGGGIGARSATCDDG